MSATTICFANIKGGVGKTTLAVNVAHTLATQFNHRVLVVDMDPQINASTSLLTFEEADRRRKTHRSIYNFFDAGPEDGSGLGGGREVAPSAVKPIPTRHENLHLILGALQLAFLELRLTKGHPLDVRCLRDGLIAIGAKDSYDYIIIDTPPSPSHYLVAALVAADFFVAPCRGDFMSIQGLALFQRIYQELRIYPFFPVDAQPLGAVLTMVQTPRQEREGREALQSLVDRAEQVGQTQWIKWGDEPVDPWFFRPFDACLKTCTTVPDFQERQRLIAELPGGNRTDELKQALPRIALQLRQRCEERRLQHA